jgi:tetratricopeptide (TPR) repeat protein
MKPFALGTLALVLAIAGDIGAQEAPDRERAKASFAAGATAYGAGEYLAAIQAFDAAYALTPLPQIAFSLAQAERRQYFVDRAPEHLNRAIELFRRYIAEVPRGGRRADALDALSQLEPLAVALGAQGNVVAPEVRVARQTRVMITSETPRAEISLDSAPTSRSPLIREVSPGKHSVEVRAQGFFPAQREVMALEGELISVEVPLTERPSTLVVVARADADVWLNGRFIGRAGQRREFELPSGKHRVTVAKKGHRVWSRTLTLGRAERREVVVTLPPTAQRVAASGFFIGGAAALSSGLVLSALAIRAENRAETFLGHRQYGNVSEAQLSSYESDVAERDRFRIATGVCWSAALGLLLSGFVLYELDEPTPQALYRAPDPRDAFAPTPVRFALTPVLGVDSGFEAGLSWRF